MAKLRGELVSLKTTNNIIIKMFHLRLILFISLFFGISVLAGHIVSLQEEYAKEQFKLRQGMLLFFGFKFNYYSLKYLQRFATKLRSMASARVIVLCGTSASTGKSAKHFCIQIAAEIVIASLAKRNVKSSVKDSLWLSTFQNY